MEIRTQFHNRLREIQNDILIMGSMTEKAIIRSIMSLKERDLELASDVIKRDEQINEKRFEIEEKCVELIATQQPIAVDLRTLMAVLNIITELERIADHAQGIAKIAIMNGDEPPVRKLPHFTQMTDKTTEMLRQSLEALINRDAVLARRTAIQDDEIDTLYSQVFQELLCMMADDPKTITRATRLVWVAHNLERSADRITNICERVVYIITGKFEEIETSNY